MMNRILRDRTLEIKFKQDEPKQQPYLNQAPTEPVEPVDITETVDAIAHSVVSGTMTVIATYMLSDTVRKVLIHNLTR